MDILDALPQLQTLGSSQPTAAAPSAADAAQPPTAVSQLPSLVSLVPAQPQAPRAAMGVSEPPAHPRLATTSAPADQLIPPPPLSDGCDPFVGPPLPTVSNQYRPSAADDDVLESWRHRLGTDLAQLYDMDTSHASNPATPSSAAPRIMLASLPAGYHLYHNLVEPKSSRQQRLGQSTSASSTNTPPPDVVINNIPYNSTPFVFGHPSGFKYSSPRDMVPHIRWLICMGSDTRHTVLDYTDCGCLYCPKYVKQCQQLYLHFTRPVLVSGGHNAHADPKTNGKPIASRHVESGPSVVFRIGEIVWVPVTFDDHGNPHNASALCEMVNMVKSGHRSAYQDGGSGYRRGVPASRFLVTVGLSAPVSTIPSRQNGAFQQTFSAPGPYVPVRVRHAESSNLSKLRELIQRDGLDNFSHDHLIRMVHRISYFPARVTERFAVDTPINASMDTKQKPKPQQGSTPSSTASPNDTPTVGITVYRVSISKLGFEMIVTNNVASPYLCRPSTSIPKSLTPSQQSHLVSSVAESALLASTCSVYGSYTNIFGVRDLKNRLVSAFGNGVTVVGNMGETGDRVQVTGFAGIRYGAEVIRVGDVVRLKGKLNTLTGDVVVSSSSSNGSDATNTSHISDSLICMIVMHIMDVSSFVPRDMLPNGIAVAGKIYTRQQRFGVTMSDYCTTMNAWFPAFKTQELGRNKIPMIYPASYIAGRFYMVKSNTVKVKTSGRGGVVNRNSVVAATHVHGWTSLDTNTPLSMMPISAHQSVSHVAQGVGSVVEYGVDDSDVLSGVVSNMDMPELKNKALGLLPALVEANTTDEDKNGEAAAQRVARKPRRAVADSNEDASEADDSAPSAKRTRRSSISSQDSERLSITLAQAGKRQRIQADRASYFATMDTSSGDASSGNGSTAGSGATTMRTRAQRRNQLRGHSSLPVVYGRPGVKLSEPVMSILSRMFPTPEPTISSIVAESALPPRASMNDGQHYILRRILSKLMHHPLAILFLPGCDMSILSESVQLQIASYYTRGRGGTNSTSLNAYIEPIHLWTVERTLSVNASKCNYATSSDFAMEIQTMIMSMMTYCNARQYRELGNLVIVFSQSWTEWWNERVPLLSRVSDLSGRQGDRGATYLKAMTDVVDQVVEQTMELRRMIEDPAFVSGLISASTNPSTPASGGDELNTMSMAVVPVSAQHRPPAQSTLPSVPQTPLDDLYAFMEHPLSKVLKSLDDMKRYIHDMSDQISQRVLEKQFGVAIQSDDGDLTRSQQTNDVRADHDAMETQRPAVMHRASERDVAKPAWTQNQLPQRSAVVQNASDARETPSPPANSSRASAQTPARQNNSDGLLVNRLPALQRLVLKSPQTSLASSVSGTPATVTPPPSLQEQKTTELPVLEFLSQTPSRAAPSAVPGSSDRDGAVEASAPVSATMALPELLPTSNLVGNVGVLPTLHEGAKPAITSVRAAAGAGSNSVAGDTNAVAQRPKMPPVSFTIHWIDESFSGTREITSTLNVLCSKNGQLLKFTGSPRFLKQFASESPLVIRKIVSRGLTDSQTRDLITGNSVSGPMEDGSTVGPQVLRFSAPKQPTPSTEHYQPLRDLLQLNAGIFHTTRYDGIVFATSKDIMIIAVDRNVMAINDLFPALTPYL